jgi:predicted dehydrogenase
VLLRQTAGSGASRAAGVIRSGWLEPARFTVTVVGTRGSLSYDYDRPTELLQRSNTGETEKRAVEDHGHRFTTQLQAFADAVVNGARLPLASFRDGLAVATLVDAAQTMAHNR